MYTTSTTFRNGSIIASQLSPRRTKLPLARTPASVRRAREHTVRVLRDWGAHDDTVDNARLVVSELATNALHHAGSRVGGSFTVGLEALGDVVEISVWDPDPTPPVEGVPEPTGTCGRGLLIVALSSLRWGHRTPSSGPGKVVWAHLAFAHAPV
jgi:anti-sigma regulatory factor (Ser/Thr protein kinase)